MVHVPILNSKKLYLEQVENLSSIPKRNFKCGYVFFWFTGCFTPFMIGKTYNKIAMSSKYYALNENILFKFCTLFLS
jgi:hypothetical protein